MEQRDEEVCELTARARRLLDEPPLRFERSLLPSASLLVRTWAYPSFDSWVSWAVYDAAGPEVPHATIRRTTWHQRQDLRRLREPLLGVREGFHTHPTADHVARDCPIEEVDAFSEEIRKLSIPLAPAAPLVLDGVRVGVELPKRGVRLEWSEPGPEPWAELDALIRRFQLTLTALFDA